MVLVPFGPLRWYRLVRYDVTDCSATLVPVGPLRWYRLTDTINVQYNDTDLSTTSASFQALKAAIARAQ